MADQKSYNIPGNEAFAQALSETPEAEQAERLRWEYWSNARRAADAEKAALSQPGRDEMEIRSVAGMGGDGSKLDRLAKLGGSDAAQYAASAVRDADTAEADMAQYLAELNAEKLAQDAYSSAPLSAGPGQKTTTTKTWSDYSTDEARKEADNLLALASQARKQLSGYAGEFATNARNRARQMSKERAALEGLAAGGEREARLRLAQMQRAYDEADIDLASLRVDPKRWENDTPAVAQVLMALASSAFSFFTGGQGPNPVMQLIDRAIDRDMKAQMVNIDAKLKGAEMGIEKQAVLDKMEGNIRSAMYQRTLNAIEMMAKEAQTDQAQFNFLQTAQMLHDKATEAELLRLEPYKRQIQQTVVDDSGAGRAAEKWDDPKVSDQVTASTQGIEALDRIYDMYHETSPWGIRHIKSVVGGSWSPITTNEGLYNEQKGSLGITMAKAAAGFQVSEADRQAFESRLPGIKDTRDAANLKMALLLADSVSKLVKTYDKASPRDKARTASEVQEGIARARQWVIGHPEVVETAKNDPVAGKFIKEIMGGE